MWLFQGLQGGVAHSDNHDLLRRLFEREKKEPIVAQVVQSLSHARVKHHQSEDSREHGAEALLAPLSDQSAFQLPRGHERARLSFPGWRDNAGSRNFFNVNFLKV